MIGSLDRPAIVALSMVAAPLRNTPPSAWMASSGSPPVLAPPGCAICCRRCRSLPPVPAPPAGSSTLRDGQLMRLNFGVFALHLIQTTMWVMVPSALVSGGVSAHARALEGSAGGAAVLRGHGAGGDRRRAPRRSSRCSMPPSGMFAVVQSGWLFGDRLIPLALLLTLFFIAFNAWATQPSWISRIAPPGSKGTALGVSTPCSRSACSSAACSAAGWTPAPRGEPVVRRGAALARAGEHDDPAVTRAA